MTGYKQEYRPTHRLIVAYGRAKTGMLVATHGNVITLLTEDNIIVSDHTDKWEEIRRD